MPNPKQRTLMQEALDNNLAPEARRGLFTQFDREPDAAAEFNRLKQVDRLLRAAPVERAPQGMAQIIMARLTQSLPLTRMRRETSPALAVGLGLVTLLVAPALMLLAWLMISTISSAAALHTVIAALSGVIAGLSAALGSLATGAQHVLAAYPEAPALMLTLIPAAALLLMHYAWSTRALRQAEA